MTAYGEKAAIIRRNWVLGVAMLATGATAVFAAPCSEEIDRMQARIAPKLEPWRAAGNGRPRAPPRSCTTNRRYAKRRSQFSPGHTELAALIKNPQRQADRPDEG